MKINKTLKKVLIGVFGTGVLLFAILVYHIATAKPLENATIQVSRIDFDKPFDSLSAADITQKLHRIPGVKEEVIVKRNVVVYFHDNRIADSKKVYDELMETGHYNAQRFQMPAGFVNKPVCPVMKKDGLSYRFSRFVQGIFN